MADLIEKLTRTRTDRFFWRVAGLIMFGDVLVGLGFLLNAPSTSSTYFIALQLMPAHHWGTVALVAGLLYFYGIWRQKRTAILCALSIGGFYVNVFALTFVISIFTGYLAGFTAIIYWGISGIIHTYAALYLPSTIQIVGIKNGTVDNYTN